MVLENDYNICFNQRDQVIIDLRKKEEILNSKQNEINHLEERLKIPSNDFNLSEMYEMEIKSIQQKLLEKSNELIRFEIIQSHKEKTNQARITQLIEKNKSLHEENCKMKELLREIASLENGTGSRSVTDRINSLLDDKNTNKSNLSMEEGIDDDSIEEENFLVTKVIGEFDKILDNEMKKVESYHRKDSNIIKRRSSAVKFKSSGERNYIEWKTRNSAATWADSLRGRSDNKSQVDKNVNEMKRLSKLRIKNSIVADSKLLEQTLKSDVDLSRSDIYTLSEVYCNRLMTKSSSPSKRYCKRIESNDKLWRE